jgi:hypothetical protein
VGSGFLDWIAGVDAVLAFILGVIAALLWVLWGAVFDREGRRARMGPRRSRGPQGPQGGP